MKYIRLLLKMCIKYFNSLQSKHITVCCFTIYITTVNNTNEVVYYLHCNNDSVLKYKFSKHVNKQKHYFCLHLNTTHNLCVQQPRNNFKLRHLLNILLRFDKMFQGCLTQTLPCHIVLFF